MIHLRDARIAPGRGDTGFPVHGPRGARGRYANLDHVRLTRAFLADPDAFLRHL